MKYTARSGQRVRAARGPVTVNNKFDGVCHGIVAHGGQRRIAQERATGTTRNRRRQFADRLGRGALFLASAIYCGAAVAAEIFSRAWVIDAGQGLAPLLGPWASQEVFLGVRWAAILVSAIVLAAVLVAHGAVWWAIQRKIRGDQAKAAGASSQARVRFHWLGHALRAATAPLVLLIWVAGVYAAITIVVRDFAYQDAAQTVLSALDLAASAGLLAGSFWLVHRVTRVLEQRLDTITWSTEGSWDRVLFSLAAKTVRLTLPLVVLILGIPLIPVSPEMQQLAANGVSLLVVGAVALVVFQLVQAAEELVLARYRADPAGRFQARRIRTQVTVLRKIVVVIIGVVTLASMLMVFESVRQFGTSILASAGIAGIIIGFAAQRSIGTLLAGFQIAFTRPIRIDDVVVVENEWGRIEDITLTFVIVCIWDQRRLILPITYFMERPFQNWTSTSSDILGTVFLHVDYTMPIQALREELDRILDKSQYWDGKRKSILVTDAKEHTLEVRAMASAADGDQAWFLRCEIREKLVEFVRKNYPESLPRVRAELGGPAAAEPAGSR